MAGPVERKVQASTAAGAVSGLALWLLGRYVFKGTAVPDVFQSWIYTLAPAAVTFAAGYLARHTPRTDGPAGNMPADIPAATRAEKTLAPPAAGGYAPAAGPPEPAGPPPGPAGISPPAAAPE